MAQETYSLLNLDEGLDEDRNESTNFAPFENMLSATHLVTSLLEAQHARSPIHEDVPAYAIMSGFSMQLRGGRRSTRDVDFATSVKMKGVWEAVIGQIRIIIPYSRLIEGVLKVFVKTGSPYDACSEQHRIEIDIMQAGFRGSPRQLSCSNVEQVGPSDLFGTPVSLCVLDVPQMVKIKVECCLESRRTGRL